MIYQHYTSPEIKETRLLLESGFAASVDGGINPITEETGSWD